MLNTLKIGGGGWGPEEQGKQPLHIQIVVSFKTVIAALSRCCPRDGDVIIRVWSVVMQGHM